MTRVDILRTRVNGKEVKSMETERERERGFFYKKTTPEE